MAEGIDPAAYEPTVPGAIWRFRWLMLVCLIAGGALGVVYAMSQPARYEAVASFVVQDPRTATLFGTSISQQPDRFVADQVAILESTEVAERSAQQAAQSGTSLTTDDLLEYGRAVSDPDSNHIEVWFEADAPESAVVGANAIANTYQAIRREATAASYASALAQLDLSIAGVTAELASIGDQIATLLTPDPAMEELDQQFALAILRLADLQESLIFGTSADEAEVAEAIRASLDDLLQQFQTLQIIAGLEEQDPELTPLLQQQTEAIGRQSALIERRDELTVDAALQSTGIVVFAPALEAEETSSVMPRALAVGLVLGTSLGAGLSYLLALRRRQFSERLQPGSILVAPFLGEVPDFRAESVKGDLPVQSAPASASAEAFRFVAASLDVRLARRGAQPPPVGTTPRSADRGGHSLLTVSGQLSDGKSVITANVALALALQGRRVLAIDADFGNQRLASLLSGQDLSPGLTEIVEAGWQLAEAVQTIDLSGGATIDLLSRGQEPVTAPEVFASAAAQAFLTSVRSEYDYVFIDAPPLLQVAYTSNIARCVDSILVVVRHGGGMRAVRDLAERLTLLGKEVAGYVYSRAPLRDDMVRAQGSLKDVLGRGPVHPIGGAA